MTREKRSDEARATNLHVGRRLAALRRARGLTVAALAQGTDTSERVLARVERGTREPDAAMLVALADILGVDVGAFFAGLGGGERGRRALGPSSQSVAETTALLEVFARIPDEDQRRRIVALLKACVDSGCY